MAGQGNFTLAKAARLSEMGQGEYFLGVRVEKDGDIVVYIGETESGLPLQGDAGFITVEFCNPAGGGGQSPHTRDALSALLHAMREDARKTGTGVPDYFE